MANAFRFYLRAIKTAISIVSLQAIEDKLDKQEPENTYTSVFELSAFGTSTSQHTLRLSWKEGVTKVDRITRTTGIVAESR